jgi:hypothetical protein
MIKPIAAVIAALFCGFNAIAGAPDSSATIASSKEIYTFVFNSKTNKVEVQRTLENSYTSNAYDVNLPIVENYNDEITIDEVTCKIDDRTPKTFSPVYSYYEQGDIFFSDSKICYFPMVLPKKNSKGQVLFKETIRDPRYFTSAYFPDELPVASKELTFVIPRWMKVDLKELNFAGHEIKKLDRL